MMSDNDIESFEQTNNKSNTDFINQNNNEINDNYSNNAINKESLNSFDKINIKNNLNEIEYQININDTDEDINNNYIDNNVIKQNVTSYENISDSNSDNDLILHDSLDLKKPNNKNGQNELLRNTFKLKNDLLDNTKSNSTLDSNVSVSKSNINQNFKLSQASFGNSEFEGYDTPLSAESNININKSSMSYYSSITSIDDNKNEFSYNGNEDELLEIVYKKKKEEELKRIREEENNRKALNKNEEPNFEDNEKKNEFRIEGIIDNVESKSLFTIDIEKNREEMEKIRKVAESLDKFQSSDELKNINNNNDVLYKITGTNDIYEHNYELMHEINFLKSHLDINMPVKELYMSEIL